MQSCKKWKKLPEKLPENFRKKTQTFVCVISCLCCIFYILVNRIAIHGIFETIPQTFGLISTLKMVFLIDFLKFLVISSSKFPHWPKSSASGARAARVFLHVCLWAFRLLLLANLAWQMSHL